MLHEMQDEILSRHGRCKLLLVMIIAIFNRDNQQHRDFIEKGRNFTDVDRIYPKPQQS